MTLAEEVKHHDQEADRYRKMLHDVIDSFCMHVMEPAEAAKRSAPAQRPLSNKVRTKSSREDKKPEVKKPEVRASDRLKEAVRYVLEKTKEPLDAGNAAIQCLKEGYKNEEPPDQFIAGVLAAIAVLANEVKLTVAVVDNIKKYRIETRGRKQ